ncbi:hypothetical protein Glove_615g46 [Diversispora epigaea]|uniref:Uncharacterized protein n=1 Tax=Diversispora epigaea TaxID=1348612 RepID=A0A397GEM9_9GLOM|nr:hypothetical protein Glove_615g46 [Diversispora epigaea]
MIQSEELNKLISELAEVYSSKVREIVQETSSFNTSQLKELQYIRKQLNLLFQIRNTCLKVLEDLELLDLYSSLSHYELAEVYSSKVREIVQETSSFNTSQLKELQYIRKQLNLLFQIRNTCLKVLEDLELLDLYSSLSH